MSERLIQSTWTKDEIESLVKSENLSYQQLVLLLGVVTRGNDQSATAETIFLDGIKGKSVLDVGCGLVFFPREAIRRGANRVVGIDIDKEKIRQAKLIAQCMHMTIDFQLRDIEEEPPDKFDIILVLNVLHHLHNPLYVLDQLAAYTKDCLIMEVAGIQNPKAQKLLKYLGASRWLRRCIENYPLIIVGCDKTIKGRWEQKYFFSPLALKHFFLDQRGDFAHFKIRKSHFKNRYIALEWKRKMNHLIVIGGLPASGKSTLCKRLLSKQFPEIAEAIGMDTSLDWAHHGSQSLEQDESHNIQNMLYHYDITRPIGNDARIYRKEKGTYVLGNVIYNTVVIVWTEPNVMCQRLECRVQRGKRNWRTKRIEEILALYRNPRRLAKRLREWTECCSDKADQLKYIDCTNQTKLLSELEWDRKLNFLEKA